jgi:hypothetical protein
MQPSHDPRAFIASTAWTFASTMPENPHEYVVERDLRGDPEAHAAFRAFVAHVRSGRLRTFRGHRYRTVEVEERTYWLTWGRGGGHIVNRKPTAEAGWDDEPGQLPLG